MVATPIINGASLTTRLHATPSERDRIDVLCCLPIYHLFQLVLTTLVLLHFRSKIGTVQ